MGREKSKEKRNSQVMDQRIFEGHSQGKDPKNLRKETAGRGPEHLFHLGSVQELVN